MNLLSSKFLVTYLLNSEADLTYVLMVVGCSFSAIFQIGKLFSTLHDADAQFGLQNGFPYRRAKTGFMKQNLFLVITAKKKESISHWGKIASLFIHSINLMNYYLKSPK